MSKPILATDALSKRFGALTATHDVSIDLNPGEIHAIIGPNGAGKSTLIKQICGEIHPDSGRVLLDDRDVSALPPHIRARAGLGRTFQISDLCMEDTVLENAILGCLAIEGASWRFWGAAQKSKTLRSRAEGALDRVGLANFRDTQCSSLSHGQRRQLEVAVALTLSPRAFVMDEPMAGLGAEGSRNLTALLDGLRAEAPILLVEHDMDAVFALADRISVMVYGAVIATGSADDIRQSADVREAYLGEEV